MNRKNQYRIKLARLRQLDAHATEAWGRRSAEELRFSDIRESYDLTLLEECERECAAAYAAAKAAAYAADQYATAVGIGEDARFPTPWKQELPVVLRRVTWEEVEQDLLNWIAGS